MADDAQNENFVRTISDRDIEFRAPTDGQMLVLGRLLRKFQGADEQASSGEITEMSKVLDIIDSMVVNPADRNWLEQGILDRSLDLVELMGAFSAADNRATKRAAKKTTKKTTTAKKSTSSRARTK